MSEEKNGQNQDHEAETDFLVEPLSDEEMEDVSGGAATEGCSDGGGCSDGLSAAV